MSRNEPGSRISSNLRAPDRLGPLPVKITISVFATFSLQKSIFLSFGSFHASRLIGTISDDFVCFFSVLFPAEKSPKQSLFHEPSWFSWKVMMFHAKSLFLMRSRDFSCKVTIFHDASWCIMLHHDASWCIMMHHVASRCITMHDDVSWCIMIHHHDASWFSNEFPTSVRWISGDIPLMFRQCPTIFRRFPGDFLGMFP